MAVHLAWAVLFVSSSAPEFCAVWYGQGADEPSHSDFASLTNCTALSSHAGRFSGLNYPILIHDFMLPSTLTLGTDYVNKGTASSLSSFLPQI